MNNTRINLFHDIPEELDQEVVEKLIEQGSFRVERIISRGQVSPTGFWYDQNEHEWVVVLAGKAQLQIEGREENVTLHPGDTYYLPAHAKHRIVWTAPEQTTIWLAIFWNP